MAKRMLNDLRHVLTGSNGKREKYENKNKKNRKKTMKEGGQVEIEIDLPVAKVGGLCYDAVNRKINSIREGKLNTLDKDSIPSDNFVEDLSFNCLKGKETGFIDLTVFGRLPATNGYQPKKKKACQDEAMIINHVIDKEEVKVFGVFDGHGEEGEKVSRSCVVLLEDVVKGNKTVCTSKGVALIVNKEEAILPSNELLLTDERQFFMNTFEYLHNAVVSANDFSAKECGTTATVISIVKNRLTLNWVGDSKAAIFISFEDSLSSFIPIFVTSAHNFQTDEEQDRIKEAGGRLGHAHKLFGKMDPFDTSPIRVYNKRGNGKPGLMISKSIGDQFAHKLGLTYKPSSLQLDFNKIETVGGLKDIIPISFNSSLEEVLIERTKAAKQKEEEEKEKEKEKELKKIKSGLSIFDSLGAVKNSLTKKISRKQIKKNNIGQNDNSFTDMSGELLDRELKFKHCVLVVGSDGLWDYLSKEDIAGVLPKLLKEKGISKEGIKNISLELGLMAIKKFREGKDEDSTELSDDVSVITNLLF